MYIDRDTIIQAIATLFCLCAAGFLAIMSYLIYHNRPRRIEAVPITPVPRSEVEWVDRAMDNMIAALKASKWEWHKPGDAVEQAETVEWRAQYRVVEEAELIAEQYQAGLESEREG